MNRGPEYGLANDMSEAEPVGLLIVYILCFLFGAAFKFGRQQWFTLRSLITNSKKSAFTGGFLKLFLKKPHKWLEELRIG